MGKIMEKLATIEETTGIIEKQKKKTLKELSEKS